MPTTPMHSTTACRSQRHSHAHIDEARLVILLHGFPYLWYMWRRQIVALAEAFGSSSLINGDLDNRASIEAYDSRRHGWLDGGPG